MTPTKDEIITELLAIPDTMRAAKARKIENWPVRSNRAGELGHPCLRYLTYMRVNWRDRPLHTADLQFLFDERRRQERNAVQDLEEAGYTFIEEQRGYDWPKYAISGRVDGKLLLPKGADGPRSAAVPAEIKNISPWDWDKIRPWDPADQGASLRQFLDSDKVWIRKIPAQITAYLILSNQEVGALILRNASNGIPKVLPVPLDLTYAETLVKTAETVNAHVAAGTLPDRIPYDEEICGRCPFFAICLPDQALVAPSLEDDEQLLEMLRKREELKPASDEYERIDKAVKTRFREAAGAGEAKFIVGAEWYVTITARPVRAYNVAERVDFPVRIQRLGKKGAEPVA